MNRLEIHEACMDWITEAWKQAPLQAKTDFRLCDEDDLIGYHHSLGQDMRNENKLWTLRDTIGCPDEFSMRVIHTFWEQLNGL
ncbi:hypothetical protein VPHD69_0133 [Vibrio phage D69]